MSAPDLRSDYPLVRHLAKTYGPLVGRAWQDLPLIQVPTERAVRLAQGDPGGWDYGHAPYDDLVLDFGCILGGPQDVPLPGGLAGYWGLGTLWARVTRAPAFLHTLERLSPWWGRPKAPVPERLRLLGPRMLVLSMWVRYQPVDKEHDGFLPTPETAVLSLDEPWACVPLIATREREILLLTGGEERLEGAKQDMRIHARIVGGVLDYLGHCPEYLVEERPAVREVRRPPAKDIKPWAFRGLPRIILLDPEHAPARSGVGGPAAGGTHASPRPHQRRAHWRCLHHPKYKDKVGSRIWVKDAWIGPREWILRGTTYRVLDPPP